MKFIFTVKVKEGHTEDEYIAAWKQGSSIIQASVGARGTTLYRKIDEPRSFLAIAEWESKEARDAGMKRVHAIGEDVEVRLNHHKDFGNTEVTGNFEEVAHVEPIKVT